MRKMTKQQIDTEAKKLRDLWVMHYGIRNADKLSMRLRREFIDAAKCDKRNS